MVFDDECYFFIVVCVVNVDNVIWFRIVYGIGD